MMFSGGWLPSAAFIQEECDTTGSPNAAPR
jgi:hypothetical protein